MRTNPKIRKTQLKNETFFSHINRLFFVFILALLIFLPTALNVGCAYANPRGTTAEIYLDIDVAITEMRPNTLIINDGQLAIILADRTTIMLLEDKD